MITAYAVGYQYRVSKTPYPLSELWADAPNAGHVIGLLFGARINSDNDPVRVSRLKFVDFRCALRLRQGSPAGRYGSNRSYSVLTMR